MDEKKVSDASVITRNYLDSILIEERIINAESCRLEAKLFGRTFSSPILLPAFSSLFHLQSNFPNGMLELASAALELNTANFVGMMENEEFLSLVNTGAQTVRIVKPYADREKSLDQLRFAEENGAIAVGMDIDHVFGKEGGYDVVDGIPMGPVSLERLKEAVAATGLPFVAKGVLSVRDALACAEAGVSAILVSHHHGRIPFAIPPLMVLPKIAEALKGSGIKILVDCGMDTGADAFKALALGADAVCTGRVMLMGLITEGKDAVVRHVTAMNAELAAILNYTGCATPAEAEPSILWLNGKPLE